MNSPLAHAMRPQCLSDFIGQNSILSSQSILRTLLKSGRCHNLILWGPPGTGKTTLASIIGKEFQSEFLSYNAVEIGSKNLREAGEQARLRFQLEGLQTIVFIDEIHRLNKSQQDILLPFIEKGDFVLIGATTENPGYELNRALLSRCHLLVLERLNKNDLSKILKRCITFLKKEESWLSASVEEFLIEMADGDARRLINMIEALSHQIGVLDLELVKQILPKTLLAYDKNSDAHYDLISAFIKSIRGSDSDAALYYLARMLDSGEDPVFVARRLVILASEDIGNADPRALQMAVAGAEAVRFVGLPECGINLAHVVTYLSSAPKSNRSYLGWLKAKECVEKFKSVPVPLHLRSSQVPSMKKLGYGLDYKYPHDEVRGWVQQNYFPEELKSELFYEPSDHGFEKNIKLYRQWLKGEIGE